MSLATCQTLLPYTKELSNIMTKPQWELTGQGGGGGDGQFQAMTPELPPDGRSQWCLITYMERGVAISNQNDATA
jgi:hypothetical protein